MGHGTLKSTRSLTTKAFGTRISRRLHRALLAGTAVVMMAVAPMHQAHAIFGSGIVLDPSNLAQNLLTAARTLQMVNQQVQMIQNQATSLINQAKHLKSLDFSSLTAINQSIGQMTFLMQQAEGIAFQIEHTDQVFSQYFPEEYDALIGNNELATHALQRFRYSMSALKQTMRVQAQIVQSVVTDQTMINDLVSRSQSSEGSLEAQQATNQLIALTAQQTAKGQQLMAAQYRATAVDAARRTEEAERTRVRFSRFIGNGTSSYTPAF